MMKPSSGQLTINLGAIQSNWRYVRSILAEGSECAAVIKADAYGVGAREVASSLYDSGCRNFYLATVEEASKLRKVIAADATIYVLGGVREGAEPQFLEDDLVPVLYSLNAIVHWNQFCATINRSLPCCIKLDTGMTRLGLSDSEFETFLSSVDLYPFLNPTLFISHLACADESQHPLNRSQLERFSRAFHEIRAVYPNVRASLANSSGTFLSKEFHFDMVRIGAALYGINPQPENPNPLSGVLNLQLPILQIRTLVSDATVGYGAVSRVESEARLAVVAGGYADGLNRILGDSPTGMIGGISVKSVGRMSMDLTIFDISALDAEAPEFVDVINETLNLDYLIRVNSFLGYEVLTSLGKRFAREYIPAAAGGE